VSKQRTCYDCRWFAHQQIRNEDFFICRAPVPIWVYEFFGEGVKIDMETAYPLKGRADQRAAKCESFERKEATDG